MPDVHDPGNGVDDGATDFEATASVHRRKPVDERLWEFPDC